MLAYAAALSYAYIDLPTGLGALLLFAAVQVTMIGHALTHGERLQVVQWLGFGLAIAEAAVLEVDATPMEGFDADALDELLGLRARGLRSVTILPLGYRDAGKDWLVNLKKVRRPREKFVTEIR